MIDCEITLNQILFDSDLLDEFGCCKLSINGEVVWDDDVEWNKYVKFSDALERYMANHKDWESYKVLNIDIQVVHFHHSVVSIYCVK